MNSINQVVAERLREAAGLLEQQGANPFRVSAYRKAAAEIINLESDLDTLLRREGTEGLVSIPSVGKGIAAAIAEIITTGRWGQLERLRGTLDPEKVFRAIPGVGPHLAREIHDHLHVDTLEALEAAAHDGRLELVPGVGPRRAATIRASLGTMLGAVRRLSTPAAEGPTAEELLEVDREYRRRADEGSLPEISPRRFNPDGKVRIPILHAVRGPWHFTVLFSNTPRAHELQRTRDWVVIYYYDDHQVEGQHTVVSESRGPLVGQRVVRGRERECRDFYERRGSSPLS